MIMLISTAITILMVWYSARKDNSVVIGPAPAISGKAIGTMEAAPGSSSLYKGNAQNHFQGQKNKNK